MTMLGSGSILRQFADAGLIDVFQFMVDPVALGDGTPLFQGLTKPLNLKLTSSKQFKSGVVLLNYEPEK
jgi:dihydrofolate reductase